MQFKTEWKLHSIQEGSPLTTVNEQTRYMINLLVDRLMVSTAQLDLIFYWASGLNNGF